LIKSNKVSNGKTTELVNSIHVYLFIAFQHTSFQSIFTESARVHISVYRDLLSEDTQLCISEMYIYKISLAKNVLI